MDSVHTSPLRSPNSSPLIYKSVFSSHFNSYMIISGINTKLHSVGQMVASLTMRHTSTSGLPGSSLDLCHLLLPRTLPPVLICLSVSPSLAPALELAYFTGRVARHLLYSHTLAMSHISETSPLQLSLFWKFHLVATTTEQRINWHVPPCFCFQAQILQQCKVRISAVSSPSWWILITKFTY